MNPELIKIAQQLMQQNPGMTPEQALRQAEQIIQRMSEGERSEDFVGRITSYNVCYTKLLRGSLS